MASTATHQNDIRKISNNSVYISTGGNPVIRTDNGLRIFSSLTAGHEHKLEQLPDEVAKLQNPVIDMSRFESMGTKRLSRFALRQVQKNKDLSITVKNSYIPHQLCIWDGSLVETNLKEA